MQACAAFFCKLDWHLVAAAGVLANCEILLENRVTNSFACNFLHLAPQMASYDVTAFEAKKDKLFKDTESLPSLVCRRRCAVSLVGIAAPGRAACLTCSTRVSYAASWWLALNLLI